MSPPRNMSPPTFPTHGRHVHISRTKATRMPLDSRYLCHTPDSGLPGENMATMEPLHLAVELRAKLKSIYHKCYLREVAVACKLTKETVHLPLGCLQGG